MRFGWLMAAAAVVCAVPAGAQTFTQYEVTGIGTEQFVNTYHVPVSAPVTNLSFSVFFDVLTSQSVYNGYFGQNDYSDGRAPVFPNCYCTVGTANGNTPNTLDYTEITATHDGGFRSDISVAYSGSGTSGFPTSVSSPNATGTFDYSSQGYSSTVDIVLFDGVISGFSVVGTSDTFKPATLSTSAIAAVPEPTTWLLMIAGFGFAGASLRSARRRNIIALT